MTHVIWLWLKIEEYHGISPPDDGLAQHLPESSRGWNTERIRESCRSLPQKGEDTHVNSVTVKQKNNKETAKKAWWQRRASFGFILDCYSLELCNVTCRFYPLCLSQRSKTGSHSSHQQRGYPNLTTFVGRAVEISGSNWN